MSRDWVSLPSLLVCRDAVQVGLLPFYMTSSGGSPLGGRSAREVKRVSRVVGGGSKSARTKVKPYFIVDRGNCRPLTERL